VHRGLGQGLPAARAHVSGALLPLKYRAFPLVAGRPCCITAKVEIKCNVGIETFGLGEMDWMKSRSGIAGA